MFKNRLEAGDVIAKKLKEKGWRFDIVLGIPRGGVVIARQIAKQFNCPLDVILAKKIGSPSLPEYAVGAVTPDGEVLVHERLKHLWEEQRDPVQRLAQSVQKEINRQLDLYRSHRKPILLEGLQILLVDDGIVTGFTIKAAILYLKRQGVSEIRIAVPVCSQNDFQALNKEADDILALYIPQQMYAVSQYYEDFSNVEDGEIMDAIYCDYRGH